MLCGSLLNPPSCAQQRTGSCCNPQSQPSAVSKTSDPTFQNQIGHILSHMDEAPEDDSIAELHSAQEDLGIDTMEYDDEFEEIQEVISSGERLYPCVSDSCA